jgi:diguanylate cyclase (GGDEF)-like protein/PAS domain S-box-containing protein
VVTPRVDPSAVGAGLDGFAAVLNLHYDGAVVIDRDQRIVFANAAAERIFGYPPDALVGKPLAMLVPERLRSRHTESCREYLRAGAPALMANRPVLQALHMSGAEVPVSISICNFDAGGSRYAIAIVRDAATVSSELGQAAARAETDVLTGLGNRAALSRRLRHELADARRGFGLLYLDLCRFKPFNDRYGHRVGDRVLRIVAERIRGAIRRRDLATRVGGDEFVVLLPGVAHPALLEQRASLVGDSICRPFSVEGVTGQVGVSIGGVIAPPHGATEAALLERADQAMYEAKRRGILFWLADRPLHPAARAD